jgi:hypothetical protein
VLLTTSYSIGEREESRASSGGPIEGNHTGAEEADKLDDERMRRCEDVTHPGAACMQTERDTESESERERERERETERDEGKRKFRSVNVSDTLSLKFLPSPCVVFRDLGESPTRENNRFR